MSSSKLNDPSAPMYRRIYRTHLALENPTDNYLLAEKTNYLDEELTTDSTITEDQAPLLTELTRSSATENSGPIDHYNIVKSNFVLMGLISLLPWHFFVNASKDLDPDNRHDNSEHRTSLQAEFFSMIAIVSSLSFLIMLYFSTFINEYAPQKLRSICALLMTTVLFAWITTYVVIDTDSWQHGFYRLALVQICLLTSFGAWYQSGVMGLAAKFPYEYAHLCMIGQGFGGVLASVVQIVVLSLKVTPTASALLYFGFALFVLVASIVMYLYLQTLTFFKFFIKKAGSPTNLVTASDDFFNMEIRTTFLIRKTWRFCVALILTCVATFGVFPGVLVHVHTSAIDNAAWSELFTPFACFFVSNVGDVIGRMLCFYMGFSAKRERLLVGLSSSRLLIVPLLFLCNIRPRVSYLPVLFHDDSAFIVMNALLAISNGYLTSVTMVYAPKKVERFLRARVTTIMVATLAAGMSLGSVMSLVFIKLLILAK